MDPLWHVAQNDAAGYMLPWATPEWQAPHVGMSATCAAWGKSVDDGANWDDPGCADVQARPAAAATAGIDRVKIVLIVSP